MSVSVGGRRRLLLLVGEYLRLSTRILMAGILPFGAMFIELFFIFSVSPAALSSVS